MAASLGPSVITNSLVASLDAADRNSFLKYSLINMSNWTIGIGGVIGFNQNGNPSTENQRFSGTNPWGQTDIIWGSFPSGNNNDDGGWNTDYFNIDKTKLYRFSVWVKRTSSTGGGTFYLGMYADGDGSRQMDNSTVNTNSYWNCTGAGGLTQDIWYLYVGHVYPYDTTYTGKHSDTGYYFANNPTKQGDVNLCNIGTGELKWSSNSTQAVHRTYHYYCGDSTTRLQFYDPRVDAIDGTEPSISELVSRSPIQLKDISGNGNNCTLVNGPTFNGLNGGNILFDGTDDVANVTTSVIDRSNGQEITVSCWIRPSRTSGQYSVFCTNRSNDASIYNWIFYQHTTDGAIAFHGSAQNKSSYIPTVNVWINVLNTVTAAGVSTLYVNGISTYIVSGYTYGNGTPSRLGIGADPGSQEAFQGNIAQTLIYNRALSATEILQNYNATKTRFGL